MRLILWYRNEDACMAKVERSEPGSCAGTETRLLSQFVLKVHECNPTEWAENVSNYHTQLRTICKASHEQNLIYKAIDKCSCSYLCCANQWHPLVRWMLWCCKSCSSSFSLPMVQTRRPAFSHSTGVLPKTMVQLRSSRLSTQQPKQTLWT